MRTLIMSGGDPQHRVPQLDGEDVSFVGFVLSLATAAARHFGDVPDPQTGRREPPDLQAASNLIAILAILDQKTRGNLSAEERSVLAQVLDELRTRYAEALGSSPRGVQP